MTIRGLLPPTSNYPPFVDDIASGPTELVTAYGFRVNVGNVASGEDIWTGTANVIPIPPLAGEQMSLVSTSAQDGVAGTGILTVEIHYLDTNGNEQTEDVVLNGVAAVNTIATNIRFINDLHAETAGTGKSAAGTITMFPVGVPGTVYTQISTGQTRHLTTTRMVPARKVCLIDWFKVSPGSAGSGDIRLRATEHHGMLITVTPPTTIFNSEDNSGLFQTGIFTSYPIPIPIPSLAIIKCSAFNVSGTPNVQSSWGGRFVTSPV
jgi:hypothetical protein